MSDGVVPRANEQATSRVWPYKVGLWFVVLGVVGLLYAPFAGLVYLALPGIVLSTWFAFVDRSPFRFGLALSCAVFLLGLSSGSIGLLFGVGSTGGDSFRLTEGAFLVIAAGLWLFPIAGLVVGLGSLVGARLRPGERRVAGGEVEELGLV